MTDFQTVKIRLAQMELSALRQTAATIDVPFGTLYKIREGITKNPRIKTVEKIAKHFRGAA